MKKSLTCALLAVIMVLLMGVTSYAVTGDIVLVPSSSDIKVGEEFTVDITIANLATENGVIAFGATLGYDATVLEFVKIEGLNTWSMSYNPDTKIMAVDRASQGKDNETIARVTFKATKAGNTEVSLTNVNLASGIDEPLKIALVSKSVTVAEDTVEPTPVPTAEPTATPTSAPTSTPTNKPNTTPVPTSNSNSQNTSKLPSTGETSMVFLGTGIALIAVAGIVCYIKYRSISKDI